MRLTGNVSCKAPDAEARVTAGPKLSLSDSARAGKWPAARQPLRPLAGSAVVQPVARARGSCDLLLSGLPRLLAVSSFGAELLWRSELLRLSDRLETGGNFKMATSPCSVMPSPPICRLRACGSSQFGPSLWAGKAQNAIAPGHNRCDLRCQCKKSPSSGPVKKLQGGAQKLPWQN